MMAVMGGTVVKYNQRQLAREAVTLLLQVTMIFRLQQDGAIADPDRVSADFHGAQPFNAPLYR
jgi:hypothetical protein